MPHVRIPLAKTLVNWLKMVHKTLVSMCMTNEDPAKLLSYSRQRPNNLTNQSGMVQ